MNKILILIIILFFSNLNALTFKSDGSIISSKGEILTKSFADRYQEALTQYTNGKEVIDWPVVELNSSGKPIKKKGFMGEKLLKEGAPLFSLPKVLDGDPVEAISMNNGLIQENFIQVMLANSTEEKITEGLDGLRERLKEYYKLGARFTKWRAVYKITESYPSKLSIHSNAHALARYAALVQESGMVPIIEPEVLMDGNHGVEECFNKTSEVIKKCFDELSKNKIDLSGTILKPNMILPGSNSGKNIDTKKIAELTLKCLKMSVPSEVPGIAFLSGGQSEFEAAKNLNSINLINDTSFTITFSYGRALQQSALKFWSKDINNIEGTQEIFNHRAKMCSLASIGKWSEQIEKN